MTNVFIATESPWAENPYMSTLVEEISANYKDITFGWGTDAFWNDDILLRYDIVHFHWPPDILQTYRKNYSADDLQERLRFIKSKGKKIISTCHNLKPHYSNDKNATDSYTTVYKESDITIHLGEYSLNLFKEQFPQTKQVLVYHHVYDTYYTRFEDKESSRNVLGWDKEKFYILCMGAFRDKEERSLIYTLARQLRKTNAYIVAPALLYLPTDTFVKRLKRKVVKTYLRNIKHIVITGDVYAPISDEKIPYYYGGADITLIPRIHNLNSGTLFLSLLMGKAIVGPDIGNIGPMLDKTHNSTFLPSSKSSLLKAIKLCVANNPLQIGLQNKKFALENLNTRLVAEKIYHLYKNV